MSPQLDCNQNQVENSEVKPELGRDGLQTVVEISEIDEDLRARVKARRQFVASKGIKVFGTSPACSPKVIPEWYDAKAFRRAQRLYRIYGTM